MHRDLTLGMGMSQTVSKKMKALNAMLTFNSTIEGIKDAVDRLNSDELLNFNNLLKDIIWKCKVKIMINL